MGYLSLISYLREGTSLQSFAIRAYAMGAVGIDVVSSHTKYCRIAYGVTRQQTALQGTNE